MSSNGWRVHPFRVVRLAGSTRCKLRESRSLGLRTRVRPALPAPQRSVDGVVALGELTRRDAALRWCGFAPGRGRVSCVVCRVVRRVAGPGTYFSNPGSDDHVAHSLPRTRRSARGNPLRHSRVATWPTDEWIIGGLGGATIRLTHAAHTTRRRICQLRGRSRLRRLTA